MPYAELTLNLKYHDSRIFFKFKTNDLTISLYSYNRFCEVSRMRKTKYLFKGSGHISKFLFDRSVHWIGFLKFLDKLFVLFIVLVQLTCSRDSHDGLSSNEFLLAGSDISNTDRKAGIIQASPGISPIQESDGLIEIKENESLFRLKVQDDPIPQPGSNGLLHFLLEYDNPSAILHEGHVNQFNSVSGERTIRLYVSKIEITPAKPTKNRKGRWRRKDKDAIVFIPNTKDSLITVKDGRHYIPLVRNVSLPSGKYTRCKVYFQKKGEVILGDTIFSFNLKEQSVDFDQPFETNAGKITTLHSVPVREWDNGLHRGETRNPSNATIVTRWNHFPRKPGGFIFHSFFHLKDMGSTIHTPANKIWIEMESISAIRTDGGFTVLNDVKTIFELLSLRAGAVALMGQNVAPPGTYSHFEIKLGTRHSIETEAGSDPLAIESRNSLRFEGPFELRGGRLTEVILDFDPNRSVFYTKDRKFVLDPTVETSSAMSMTPTQHNRLVNALGPRLNSLLADAEFILQGRVSNTTAIVADNLYGGKMTYSNVDIAVQDRLRGKFQEPSFTIRNIGGYSNGRYLKVAGMPEFTGGEEFILFLKEYSGRLGVLQGELGKVNLSGSILNPPPGKWAGMFPRIYFRINPQIPSTSMTTDDVMKAITNASGVWSFQTMQSHFDFAKGGGSPETKPFAPNLQSCTADAKAEFDEANRIFATAAEDPDCTGLVCTFLWQCDDEYLHFDIQLNANAKSFSLYPANSTEYDLQSVFSHALGHAAGLNHCSPGDTESQCQSRGNVQGQANDSLLFPFLDPGTVRRSTNSDDRIAFRNLYGFLTNVEINRLEKAKEFSGIAEAYCAPPCLVPWEETNPKYIMTNQELSVFNEHFDSLEEMQFDAVRGSYIKNMQYREAMTLNPETAEGYMKRTIQEANEKINGTSGELVAPSRNVLSIQIQNRLNMLEEDAEFLDPEFVEFTKAEIKVLIQLRRKYIDRLTGQ
ncbi:DUF4382 domain-containing protein [Leptospira santarosai]|uniref:DUF4382 domain-containing protein n=1 Tax=Leptospira santarosai TaxID=28183 RepID=UPI0024AFFD88|nr:DUF4382 domain-containing protein [Leptospira santarosai]MDI7166062.1 DUF4382 domain-containing protein [Leptospira santarosai]